MARRDGCRRDGGSGSGGGDLEGKRDGGVHGVVVGVEVAAGVAERIYSGDLRFSLSSCLLA